MAAASAACVYSESLVLAACKLAWGLAAPIVGGLAAPLFAWELGGLGAIAPELAIRHDEKNTSTTNSSPSSEARVSVRPRSQSLSALAVGAIGTAATTVSSKLASPRPHPRRASLASATLAMQPPQRVLPPPPPSRITCIAWEQQLRSPSVSPRHPLSASPHRVPATPLAAFARTSPATRRRQTAVDERDEPAKVTPSTSRSRERRAPQLRGGSHIPHSDAVVPDRIVV